MTANPLQYKGFPAVLHAKPPESLARAIARFSQVRRTFVRKR
jgi:hypothetical protein